MSVFMDGYEEGELSEEDIEDFIYESLDSSGVSIKFHSVELED